MFVKDAGAVAVYAAAAPDGRWVDVVIFLDASTWGLRQEAGKCESPSHFFGAISLWAEKGFVLAWPSPRPLSSIEIKLLKSVFVIALIIFINTK